MPVTTAPLRISKPHRRGTEYRIAHTVLTPAGTPQDITGATFTANVRSGESKDAPVVFSLTQTVVSIAGGVMHFSLTPTQTLALPTGIDHWVSVYVSHATWTSGLDRLELHGKLDMIG